MKFFKDEQVRGEKVTVAGQLVTNNPTAGQMVYVSHHPTLANVQQLSAPAAQAALAIQGTSHDAGASSSHSAGHHTTVTSVHQIQNTLPQQSQQQLEQQLQHYQQLQRKHQIQQQQQQQQIEHRQIQPQGTIIQHTLQHAQQHNQNAQRHQQQIQQSTGIQVSRLMFGTSNYLSFGFLLATKGRGLGAVPPLEVNLGLSLFIWVAC